MNVENALYPTADRIADLMAAPQLAFFRATPEGTSLLQGTALDEWLQRMCARPSMRATEPDLLKRVA